MSISEAQMRAVAKYNKANYDEIKIRVRKGYKDDWKSAAEKSDKSLAQLIVDAVTEYIERECL